LVKQQIFVTALTAKSLPARSSVAGPWLPTWATQQVGSYPRYTGREGNVVATAPLDPKATYSQSRGPATMC